MNTTRVALEVRCKFSTTSTTGGADFKLIDDLVDIRGPAGEPARPS